MSSLLDVSFTRKFVKQFKKLAPKSQQQFKNRLEIFLNDQHHTSLRRHPLKGKYAGYYSIDIYGDLRRFTGFIQTSNRRLYSVFPNKHTFSALLIEVFVAFLNAEMTNRLIIGFDNISKVSSWHSRFSSAGSK